MTATGRFAVAFVLCIGLASAAVVGTILRSEANDALAVGELLRLESSPDSETLLGDHFDYSLELLRSERLWTEADMAQRFTPAFRDVFPVEALRADFSDWSNETRSLSFVRIVESQPDSVRTLLVNESGQSFELGIFVDADDFISAWAFDVAPIPPPLSAWETSLVLVGGWLMVAGAALAWRHEFPRAAWMMVSTSVVALSSVLILSRSGVLYSVGRTLPSGLAVLGVVLLLGGELTRHRSAGVLAVGAAVAAVVAGFTAPLVRDATLIGHPAVVGGVIDDETTYRALMSASAGFTALAFAGVALVVLWSIRRTEPQLRPPLWGAALVALIWAGAAGGAAVDLANGDGLWAYGAFRAVTLVAVALMPLAVIFRLATQRWARPGLAALVIDLKSEAAELQPAIAKALEDPSLQVLTSPDGESLLDDSGFVIDPDVLGADRSLTRIQSGTELVGALVHTMAVQRHPERLQSVAAAAGMAMQVNRLNQKVVAQLAEVDASRTRILEASDSARRRVERDLHDGAQQRLVALGIRLQKARRIATTAEDVKLAGQLDEASVEVRDILQELRDVSRGAQPALLAERGLASAIDALAERAPVPVTLNIVGVELSPDIERTAYFVIAEGLTNMAKHAEASKANVSLSRHSGVARITITDDGMGGATMTPGSGLEGLKDRVAAAGGEFSVSSGPAGTTLEAEIPCG